METLIRFSSFILSELIQMIVSKAGTKILFIAFTIFLSSCKTVLPSFSEQDHWYRTYSGKLGEKEIVLHLTKADSYKGYIWLKNDQVPVNGLF